MSRLAAMIGYCALLAACANPNPQPRRLGIPDDMRRPRPDTLNTPLKTDGN